MSNEESGTGGLQWRDLKYVTQAVLIAILIETLKPFVDIVERSFADDQLEAFGRWAIRWREYLAHRFA